MVENASAIDMMKWYTWLNSPYRQILMRYQQKSGHHALLLHSPPGNGEASLCYALSRWLMCRQPDDIKSCGVCRSCRLMIGGNHPDFYRLESGKGLQSLAIDNVRAIVDSLYFRAHQGGVKVIWLPHAELLAEQIANSLLKILEEPPKDVYFLLACRNPSHLLPTFRSRCLYWPLPVPNEAVGLCWLQQAGFDDLMSSRTALRLCAYAPLAAYALLQPARWQERLALCAALHKAHVSGDFLTLLPALNKDKDDDPLNWLLSLLADALKLQQGAQTSLVNVDKADLVAALAKCWPATVLHAQWQQWLHCLHQWRKINNVNRELLSTHCLLNWEQGLTSAHVSL